MKNVTRFFERREGLDPHYWGFGGPNIRKIVR